MPDVRDASFVEGMQDTCLKWEGNPATRQQEKDAFQPKGYSPGGMYPGSHAKADATP
jgi:hypothetical protein